MILYVDTSALAKRYLDEPWRDLVEEAIQEASHVASSTIGYVELVAALARAQRMGRINQDEYERVRGAFETDWQGMLWVRFNDNMMRDAALVATYHGLRAYDAVHLASCLALDQRTDHDVVFACFDHQLTAAAVQEGLPVVTART